MSLKRALAVIDDDPDEAVRLANEVLRDDPQDTKALFIVATVLTRAERFGMAIALLEKITRLNPQRPEAWNNLGLAWNECDEPHKARQCFEKAIANRKDSALYHANMGSSYMVDGQYEQALKWCRKALDLDPGHDPARATMGFARLAQGDWSAWTLLEHCLGGKFRKVEDFGAPKWAGEPVDRLVVYGEQGLGDEIMFASCLPDAMQRAKEVTLECDPRLEGLFRRSFPALEVHGTRRMESEWAIGRDFDAQCAIGSLPALFRPTRDACPRTPYLVADPERRVQWRALFDAWGRNPVVGLCWSGGRATTQKKQRSVGLKAFASLLGHECHFVSLQYKDATAECEGTPVRHIRRAVESPDYDDTAAFVAECDLIVGIHTTVHHLAGALGVPSAVLVPAQPMWNYAGGDSMPWYPAQPYHRQRRGESWADCVKRIDLDSHLRRL